MNALRVDHTAVVVRDLDEAVPRYEALYGVRASERRRAPGQPIEVVMLRIGESEVELIQPTDAESGVARFLASHGEGLHHVALQVQDIRRELDTLRAQGYPIIEPAPRRGVHGLVAFIHPRGTGGVLTELVEHVEQDLMQG